MTEEGALPIVRKLRSWAGSKVEAVGEGRVTVMVGVDVESSSQG